MNTTRILVFDLDDTLFPERAFVRSGFQAVSDWIEHDQGVSGFFDIAWQLFLSGKRHLVFDQTLDYLNFNYSPALIQHLVQIYRNHEPLISLHEDAAWALSHFQNRLKLGLITNGYLRTQQTKVRRLGIESYFDALIYCDRYGLEYWKPSPRGFQDLMTMMACEGHECVYVGDHPYKDFVAPKQLGWQTVRIQRDGGEFATVVADPALGAEHTIRSLYDLQALLAVAVSP
ncbi:MAG: HAD family hydrolase [Synechococcales bacterium]|nr:HAD family hydrolase [Synechococcales bacterium]